MGKENYQNKNFGVITHYVYGIINLYNHMHFLRYLDVLASTVVFHFYY